MPPDTGKPKQLRELEAKVQMHEKAGAEGFIVHIVDSQLAYGLRDGYRMALADPEVKEMLTADLDAKYGAVVAAAQRVADADQSLEAEVAALRDALTGMEVED